MKTPLFEKFGEMVSGRKGRWVTLLVWVIIAIALNFSLPQASTQKNDRAENLESTTPSQQAQQLTDKEFSSGTGTPALLTWHRATGLTDGDLTDIQTLSKEMFENPVKHQESVAPFHKIPLPVLKSQVSKDGTTFILPVTFKENAGSDEIGVGLDQIQDKIKDIFSNNPLKTKINNKTNLSVRITGPAGIAVDSKHLFSQGDLSLLFGTVAIVLILLLVIYRSPILAIIPLAGVGIAYGVTSPLLGAIGESGLAEFDSQALSIMTVLLFGAGTDYCLFLIARYRSFLEKEKDKFVAIKLALGGSFGAIAMSGLTVVFSLFVLLLAKYGAVHRFAVPFSLSILIMMVASLTLVPALLSILGRASFYPFIPRTEEMKKERALKKGKALPTENSKEGFGLKLGGLIIKRPWQVMIMTIAFLSVFAFFSSKIVYTYDTLSSFPKDMPSREGFALISEHYNPGELAPVRVIVQTDGKDLKLAESLKNLPFIEAVSEPQQGEKDKNLVSYQVQLNTNPYSNKAMERIPDIRKAVEGTLKNEGISQPSEKVWIGGLTAEQYDTKMVTDNDSSIIIPTIIILIGLLLLVYLRSVTATAYLIGTVLLSYFSALGLGWVILHYLFDVNAIQGFIPLYAFVFIVALGEDYNIFMVSTIWKKSKKLSLSQAVKQGVEESGSVITSAGLILAATFTVLTTMPIQVLVHFGTITAIGVLLDTFIVRPFLVPAITVLLGKWVFWPSKRNIAQHKSVEK
ncbi:MMPL family transporter [Bacillus sp. 1NLA3E]|uniref:MMPL family transporter n=1 Tax=Bacillus sp. 1NLA3E TaxID=666686 RepID=UPI000247EA4F|nr:MMPL family transporter [Bacillus sp. 1NLA3E]AGK52128.1 MMPL domain protein [Bacillus sp. 1NLA3E]